MAQIEKIQYLQTFHWVSVLSEMTTVLCWVPFLSTVNSSTVSRSGQLTKGAGSVLCDDVNAGWMVSTPSHAEADYVTVVANFLLTWTETALFLRIMMCPCIFSVSDMLYLWDRICVHEFLLSIYYKVGMLWVQEIQYTILSRLKFAIWWKKNELNKWYKCSKFTSNQEGSQKIVRCRIEL